MLKNILIIEDEPYVYEIYEFFLKEALSESCKLKHVSGVLEAKTCLAENSYDLILSDHCLADGNGFDLYLQLRKQNSIPFLLISGGDLYSQEKIIHALENDLNFRVLTKPFKEDELINKIQSFFIR